jgi:hypothetical protein
MRLAPLSLFAMQPDLLKKYFLNISNIEISPALCGN